MPFGANPEPWTSAAGISYAVVAEIVDAAARLAELALSDGDLQLGTWAARQGQLADRYDQGLWRILLRTAGDNPTRDRIWQELCDLLAVDGDDALDLDPVTVDLYGSSARRDGDCRRRRPSRRRRGGHPHTAGRLKI